MRFKALSKNPLTNRIEKVVCPYCKSPKKTFRKFWDYERQEFVNNLKYGVCDRINSCGYNKYPDAEYYNEQRANPEKTSFRYLRGSSGADLQRIDTRQSVKYTFTEDFKKAMNKYTEHAFKTFLLRYFDSFIVDSVLHDCATTGTREGKTIFWQINESGEALTGRIMQYNTDGHRNKKINPYWVHNVYQRAGKIPQDYQPPKCLFGLHRLCQTGDNRTKVVYIVESEKTAVMAECMKKQYGYFQNSIFLATGGATFTAPILAALPVIRFYNCVPCLFPDCDKVGQRWKDFAKQHGIKIYNGLSEMVTPEQAAAGYDLADVIFDDLQQRIIDAAPEAAPERQKIFQYDYEIYSNFPY